MALSVSTALLAVLASCLSLMVHRLERCDSTNRSACHVTATRYWLKSRAVLIYSRIHVSAADDSFRIANMADDAVVQVEPLSRLKEFHQNRAAIQRVQQSFVCPLEGEVHLDGGHVKSRNRRKLTTKDAELLQLGPAAAASVVGRASAVCDRCYNKVVGLRRKAATNQAGANKENVPPTVAEMQRQLEVLQSQLAIQKQVVRAERDKTAKWKRRVTGSTREGERCGYTFYMA